MILLTGATGLLGSYLARHLLEKGIPFKALDRGNRPPQIQDIADRIDWIGGDIEDVPTLEAAIKDVDTIIHCAALVSFNKKDYDRLLEVNVGGTRNLVNVALLNNVKNFVYVSSTGAFARKTRIEEIDESNKWFESALNTKYGFTKYLGELEVWRGQEEGLNCLVVNPCVILGPGQYDRSSAQLFSYVLKEKKFYTRGMINYVDVRDVSDIIFRALENQKFGERLIACAGHADYENFFSLIGKHLNKKPPHLQVNSRYVRIFAILEGIRSRFTGKDPLITRETAEQTRMRITYSNKKVKSVLGFEFRSLENTIEWCCGEVLKIEAAG